MIPDPDTAYRAIGLLGLLALLLLGLRPESRSSWTRRE